jgi:hypothetical protein
MLENSVKSPVRKFLTGLFFSLLTLNQSQKLEKYTPTLRAFQHKKCLI